MGGTRRFSVVSLLLASLLLILLGIGRGEAANYTEALRAEYSKAVEQLLRVSAKVERRIADLDSKEELWSKTEKVIEENIAKAQSKVKLDVGGKSFHTSKSALLRFEGSFFWTMIARGTWQPDEEGIYFIDRNPKHFERILDYLRTGEFEFNGLDGAAIYQLEKDFDFYQLPLPQNWHPSLRWDPTCHGNCLQLSNGNKTVSKVSSGGVAGILGTKSVESYEVTINSRGTNGNIRIGLAPLSGFQLNGQTFDNHGYYIMVANGKLYGPSYSVQAFLNTAINNNDRLTVKYNTERKQISYALNGKDLGVAFSNVPAGLYPAVLFGEQASVTLT